MGIIKFIRGLFKKDINIKDKTSKNIDLGSSSVKYCIDGKLGNFISSVRVLDNDVEIVDQQNIIKVNNVWYSIGESKTPVSSETRKCKKQYIDIMCLYSLIREKTPSGQYNINTLLPYTQLQDKQELRNKIRGTYTVETTTGQKYKYVLDCPNVKCEGQMSYYYIKQLLEQHETTMIVNIGFFSTDIAVYKGDEQEEPVTIQTGTNILLNQYKHKLNAPNTSVLSYKLMHGDKFTKQEEHDNIRSIENTLRALTNDIEVVLRFLPSNTHIVLCGGGAIQYGDMIKERLQYKNITVLRGDKAVYTDVLGLAKHCSNVPVQVETVEQEETEQLETVEQVVSEEVEQVETKRNNVVQLDTTVQNNNVDVYTCILERNEQEGTSVVQLCKEYGVSRTGFYKWKNALVKVVK